MGVAELAEQEGKEGWKVALISHKEVGMLYGRDRK